MRVVAGVVCCLAVAGQVQASSVLVMGTSAPPGTPSIVNPGQAGSFAVTAVPGKPSSLVAFADATVQTASVEPAKGGKLPEIRPVSESVIAMGQPAPPVSSELVAAIDNDKPEPRSGRMPLVIRGGLFGDAAPEQVELSEPEKELSRPEQRKLDRDRRRAEREASGQDDAPQPESAAAPQEAAAPEAPAADTPDLPPPPEPPQTEIR